MSALRRGARAAAVDPGDTELERAPRSDLAGPTDVLDEPADPEDASEPEPTDPLDPAVSANATGSAATAEPMPSAIANAPTRPT